jgi:hypothetical protein
MTPLGMIVGQAIPLAPSLGVRLIALFVVEAVLLTTAVLLYVRWVQSKKQPLDEWWAERQAQGLQPRSIFLMEESDRERRATEGDAPPERPPSSGRS